MHYNLIEIFYLDYSTFNNKISNFYQFKLKILKLFL